VTDEVPTNGGTDRCHLAQRFLDPVFAEIALSSRNSGPDVIEREGLGDRDETYVRGRAARGACGAF